MRFCVTRRVARHSSRVVTGSWQAARDVREHVNVSPEPDPPTTARRTFGVAQWRRCWYIAPAQPSPRMPAGTRERCAGEGDRDEAQAPDERRHDGGELAARRQLRIR